MLEKQCSTYKNAAYNGETLHHRWYTIKMKGQYRGKSIISPTRDFDWSLLGDGTLRRQGTRTNALLEVNHSL